MEDRDAHFGERRSWRRLIALDLEVAEALGVEAVGPFAMKTWTGEDHRKQA